MCGPVGFEPDRQLFCFAEERRAGFGIHFKTETTLGLETQPATVARHRIDVPRTLVALGIGQRSAVNTLVT